MTELGLLNIRNEVSAGKIGCADCYNRSRVRRNIYTKFDSNSIEIAWCFQTIVSQCWSQNVFRNSNYFLDKITEYLKCTFVQGEKA